RDWLRSPGCRAGGSSSCSATGAPSSGCCWSRGRRRAPDSMRTASARLWRSTPSRTARSSPPASGWPTCRTTRRAPRRTCSARPTKRCTPPRGRGRTRWRPHRGRPQGSHSVDSASRDILIVDDDRQVREVLHQIFLSAGYGCHLAEDGRAGVALFTDKRPELIVTDLKMPIMSGIELLQRIRAIDGDAAVIVLTGAADVKTAIDSLKLGAYDFIMKPVNVEELLIAADRAIERRQLLIERRAYQAMLERRVEEATQHLKAAYQELEATYGTTLEALGSALDTRDIGTESHSRRVHGYALATAKEYGVAHEVLRDLAHGVLLHDIG